jgi:hypothetical protein
MIVNRGDGSEDVARSGKIDYKLLILSDGPCHPDSFRPSEDKSQWWARRDALVRILDAQQQGRVAGNEMEAFSYIMFHNGNSDSDDKSVSVMSCSLSVNTVSEEEVLHAMKRCGKSSSQPRLETSRFLHQPNIVCHSLSAATNNISVQSTHLVGAISDTSSKKEILSILQSQCSIDHLRKHNLNSTAEIVLKKKNVQQLREAWNDWNASQSNNSYDSKIDQSKDSTEFELIKAYTQIFDDCVRRRISEPETPTMHKMSILLLHEDYKDELPVFGDFSFEQYPEHRHTILYVLGAVRDMTSAESRCLWQAAQQRDIPLITANLGRTAEFTSKIVMALRAHALYKDRLYFATQSLFRKQQLSQESSELLQKLVSVRGNHSTWDGYNTNPTVSDSAAIAQIDDAENSLSMYQQIIVVAILPFSAGSMTLELGCRKDYLPCIRLIVNTLWKSRLVCDSSSADNDATKRDSMSSVVYIQFSCGAVLRIDQACVAKQVAENHCPAPSEYQVLAMLQRLIADSSCASFLPFNSVNDQGQLLLRKVYSDLVESSTACPDHIYTGIFSDISSLLSTPLSLTQLAYSTKCWCQTCSAAVTLENPSRNVLVLGTVLSSNGPSPFPSSLYRDHEILSSFPKKFQKRISTGYAGSLCVYPLNQGYKGNDHFKICIIQHFAYHGVLFSALKQYLSTVRHEEKRDVDVGDFEGGEMKSKKRNKEGREEPQRKKHKK